MAALGNLKAKVLLQIGDGEPVEVGTVLIPLVVSRGQAVGNSLHVDINVDPAGFPFETDAWVEPLTKVQRPEAPLTRQRESGQTVEVLPNPDCRDGKHGSCTGYGYDLTNEESILCPCDCHSTDSGR